MYTPGPSEAELQAIGLRLEDVQDNSITEIWPENHTAFRVFSEWCATQWMHGMGGPTGLNYPSVIEGCKLYGVKKKDLLQEVSRIQVMEREALRCLNKQDSKR